VLPDKKDTDLAQDTRLAVEAIKKLVAATKASKPDESSILEKTATEVVLSVKGVLTTKGADQKAALEKSIAKTKQAAENTL